MPTVPNTFIPKEGLVKNAGAAFFNEGGYATLTNMRLVPGGMKLEQTPCFYQAASWAAGAYWDGSASQTEPSDTPILVVNLNQDIYTANRYVIRKNSTQLQVIRQTSLPTGDTLITNCLAIINSYSGLNLTLGNTLDVVIEAGGVTFKYRKNGGAYTLGVGITTTGVSIDGGNVTLYFLTATGFNPGDTWSWTRTDSGMGTEWYPAATGVISNNSSFWVYGTKIYFLDRAGQVMVIENGGVRSVGYRPVYGFSLVIFKAHLFVGSYSRTTFYLAAVTRSGNLINSDLTDLDNFHSTDTNEADTYALTGSPTLGNTSPQDVISGLSVIRSVIFVYAASQVWASVYLGLPIPFSFEPVYPMLQTTTYFRPFSNGVGDYVVTNLGIGYFDGGVLRQIDDKIQTLFTDPNFTVPVAKYFDWGFYDSYRKEAYFYLEAGIYAASLNGFLVYQELTRTWYFRAADFSTGVSAACSNGSVVLGSGLGYLNEDKNGTQTPLKDVNSGASFQVPTIESNDLPLGSAVTRKTCSGGYLEAYYSNPSSGYSITGLGVEFVMRTYLGGTITYPAAFTWTTSSPDGTISIRGNGRFSRFRIKPTLAAGKASFGFVFSVFTVSVDTPVSTQVVR